MARNTPPSLISFTKIAYNASTTPRSSSSISWNAGDQIIALQGNENGTTQPAIPTATGLTFTKPAGSPSDGTICGSAVFIATPGSSGSSAVQGTGTSGQMWGLSIWVWRGSDGAGVNFEQHTATKTVSATPTDTHSAFCWGAFDFSATAVGTTVGAPTPTHTNESAQESGTTYSAFVYDLVDETTGTAKSFGISGGTSSGPFSIVGMEVLGTTVAAAATWVPTFVSPRSSFK